MIIISNSSLFLNVQTKTDCNADTLYSFFRDSQAPTTSEYSGLLEDEYDGLLQDEYDNLSEDEYDNLLEDHYGDLLEDEYGCLEDEYDDLLQEQYNDFLEDGLTEQHAYEMTRYRLYMYNQFLYHIEPDHHLRDHNNNIRDYNDHFHGPLDY